MKRLEAGICKFCSHSLVHSRWCSVGRSFVISQLVKLQIDDPKPKALDKPKRTK